MFNWFKSKVELKNNSSIMSSHHNKKGIKLGSEIVVPDSFELLVFYKEKHYLALSSGKYKVDKKLFEDIISHQQKRKLNIKYIKCVLHYINISPQTLKIKYKKQNYIVEFIITNSLAFSSLLLLHCYKVDNDYTTGLLCDIFHELLLYHKGNYSQITNNSLNAYGITISRFEPDNHKVSIFKEPSSIDLDTQNVSENKKETSSNKEDSFENGQNNTTQPTEKEISMPINIQFPSCPKCNHVAKFNTTYCLRCGYKLQ